MKKHIINYVVKRLNFSTICAIALICVLIIAYNEIVGTIRWFISTQLRILLSDKEIVIGIITFIVALFHKK